MKIIFKNSGPIVSFVLVKEQAAELFVVNSETIAPYSDQVKFVNWAKSARLANGKNTSVFSCLSYALHIAGDIPMNFLCIERLIRHIESLSNPKYNDIGLGLIMAKNYADKLN